MSILNALFSTPMTAVTAGPGIISLGMSPRTEAGSNFMKGFDEGAITSIADETAGLDFQDFGNQLLAFIGSNMVFRRSLHEPGKFEGRFEMPTLIALVINVRVKL